MVVWYLWHVVILVCQQILPSQDGTRTSLEIARSDGHFVRIHLWRDAAKYAENLGEYKLLCNNIYAHGIYIFHHVPITMCPSSNILSCPSGCDSLRCANNRSCSWREVPRSSTCWFKFVELNNNTHKWAGPNIVQVDCKLFNFSSKCISILYVHIQSGLQIIHMQCKSRDWGLSVFPPTYVHIYLLQGSIRSDLWKMSI